ncbi:MAG TPA: GH1 family beta-glucosidase [Ktedonobacterales bacterium]|nr:GH1 family beta-glucosidase [Ktedonobacterales bacterium]
MRYPDEFLWGAATSAYQIEGATRADGRGPSIWDWFAAAPGRTHHGETGEIAADHYRLMEQDVALMADLGLTAYRFSIAWPRIQPTGAGEINQAGLAFYDRLVDCLLEKGITPVATLYHWDLPLALYERGGWRLRDTAYAFADYAEVMARALGDRVGWWVTQNEPWCSAYLGYVEGLHAPGAHGDIQAAVEVAHHLLLSHGLAVPRIRASAPGDTRVGIALNLFPIFAADGGVATVRGVQRADRFHNRWFLDPLYRGEYTTGLFDDLGAAPPAIEDGDMAIIATPTDFLGINYYNRWVVRAKIPPDIGGARTPVAAALDYIPAPNPAQSTAMGWEVYPHGLTLMLEELARVYRPPAILITENGAAFDDTWNGNGRVSDPLRVAYLRDHLEAVNVAMAHGAPVAGYFAWSLLDNFEWADGYSKRFGLVYVDFDTQRRVLKDSGRWYSGYIAAQRAATRS